MRAFKWGKILKIKNKFRALENLNQQKRLRTCVADIMIQ